jgi:hypothetical protein
LDKKHGSDHIFQALELAKTKTVITIKGLTTICVSSCSEVAPGVAILPCILAQMSVIHIKLEEVTVDMELKSFFLYFEKPFIMEARIASDLFCFSI